LGLGDGHNRVHYGLCGAGEVAEPNQFDEKLQLSE
jgi:hypothetical protein